MLIVSERIEKIIQSVALVFSIGFFFFTFGAGLAQYYGVTVDFSKIFADTSNIAIPVSIELSPVGSADLSRLKVGDYFQAQVKDNAGVILNNLDLDVKYIFTPPGGESSPEAEVLAWAKQDDQGYSRHEITATMPAGTYQLTAIRDSRLISWQEISGAIVTIIADQYPVCENERCSNLYYNCRAVNIQYSTGYPVCNAIGADSFVFDATCTKGTETGKCPEPTKTPVTGEGRGELRGKTSFGDKYIRDSSGPECQSDYLLDGVAISYSGPESGTLVQNQCSLVSGHPIFSKKLSTGKYRVSITVPTGWVAEGGNSFDVDIKKDQETVQLFAIRKKEVIPVNGDINLILIAVSPAKLKELKAGDQYSVKATYSNGTPLRNKILDVTYLGPDTAGEEKIVEQWAQLDDNGFALMNITKDMLSGDYTIQKVRVHITGDENSGQGFIEPTNKPSLKITKTKTDLSQFITFYPNIEYSQLTDEEKVVYKILDRLLLGNDTDNIISISNRATNLVGLTKDSVLGTKLRYLGRGIIITDDIGYYLKQIGDSTTGTAGFTISKRDILGFLKELRNEYEDTDFVRTLVNFKIFEYDGKVLDIGPEGSDGFIVISNLKFLSHELVHKLDDLNEESRKAVVDSFNSLSPEDQISFFLSLCRLGYNNAFDSFGTITEWHSFTSASTLRHKLFFEFYELAKKDFDASLIKFIEIDSGAKTSFVEEVFKSIKIHYDKNTKQFLITILGEDGTVIEEIKIDWETFKQIPSIIRKYYEKLLITNCKPSSSCSKAARDEILELLKVPMSSFTGTKVYEDGKVSFYRNGNIIGPQGAVPTGNVVASLNILPKQTDRVAITVTVRFPGALYSDTDYQLFNKAIIVVKKGDIVIAATTVPDIFKGSGLNLPSNPEVVAIDLTRIVKSDTNIFYAKDVNGDEYYINVDPKYNTLSPTGFAQIRRADGTMTIVLPGGGKVSGKVVSNDGKTIILDETEGWTGTLYIFDNGAGGYGSCTVERDCQLYDSSGKQTWRIDRDGYVTNPNNGWNGNNPFDASRAQIFLGNTGNALGQVNGWVKDNQGVYHNGGYVWPSGDVSPNGMGYNMPEIKRWRTSPTEGPGDETNNIIIRARGTFARGSYPIMELRQSGKTLQSWQVTGDYKDYTYSINSLGKDNFQVAFTNDYYKPPKDRNLEVDYISVNGKIYQSESREIYSTGTYTLLDRCKPGFKTSQFLQCPGYFEYPTFEAIKP